MNNNFVKFKKRATITTANNDRFLLERNRFFIMPHRGIKNYKHKYGNICTITKLDHDNNVLRPNDVSFITDIFSFDDNRLRFLVETYKGATMFDTEMHDNGKELPITVIEKYDDKKQTIGSLSIKDIKTDLEKDSLNNDVTVTYFDIAVRLRW